MYWKIVSGGKIIDAAEDRLNYVRWQEKNRIYIACGVESAEAVVTTDGEEIYLLPGTPQVSGLDYAEVLEISEEEYLHICEELDAGGEVIDPEEKPGGEPKTRLRYLEEQVKSLAEMNSMLVECVMELSEIIYA